MPLLAGLLLKVFGALLAFFGAYMTKQIAMRVAAIAIFVSLTAALILAIKATILGLSLVVPVAVVEGAAWAMPSNADECLAAYLAAVTIRWVYDMKCNFAQMRLF